MKRPPGMELGQWWRHWHRTGHRWMEKCSVNVLVAIRNRMLSWAGHVARLDYKDICAKALRCRGLQWWRWKQLNWKEERETNGLAHTHNGSKSTGGRTWLLGRSPNLLEMRMVCRELSKTTRDGCILLKTLKAGSNFRNMERAQQRFSGCNGDKCASGMTGTTAVVAWMIERRIVRERFGVHLLPLSRHHTHCDIAMMLSWYNAGYGWLGSYGSWSGRRRGSWDGKSEARSDVEWSRLQSGTKVLRWNVGWRCVLVADFWRCGPEPWNDRLSPCGRVDHETTVD